MEDCFWHRNTSLMDMEHSLSVGKLYQSCWIESSLPGYILPDGSLHAGNAIANGGTGTKYAELVK